MKIAERNYKRAPSIWTFIRDLFFKNHFAILFEFNMQMKNNSKPFICWTVFILKDLMRFIIVLFFLWSSSFSSSSQLFSSSSFLSFHRYRILNLSLVYKIQCVELMRVHFIINANILRSSSRKQQKRKEKRAKRRIKKKKNHSRMSSFK